MRRLLVSIVAVALAASTALAKPGVAVLGIEVVGKIDEAATVTARVLTEGMRSRAKVAAGPLMLAPSSDRELIDEKLLNDCASEEPACMAAIGRGLGAQVLAFGQLQRVGNRYRVKLTLLDVKNKAVINRMTMVVPPGSNGDQLRAQARKAFVELTDGAVESGELIVKSNVAGATVFIDDDERGTIEDGAFQISLPSGRYRVAIEAEGYRRKELTVKVENDDTTTQRLRLARVGEPDEVDNPFPWRTTFYASAAVGGGLGLITSVLWLRYKFVSAGDITATKADGSRPTHNDCDGGSVAMGTGVSDLDGSLARVCSQRQTQIRFGIATLIVAPLVAVSGYMTFRKAKEERGTAARRTRGARFAIVPELDRDGAGASLRVDW